MSAKGKRPLRALTAADKIEAIQRVNDGESKASVARDIGVPESTLRGWCKNEDKLRYMSTRHSTPDTDKSDDAEPLDKRARCDASPPRAAPAPEPERGLDLSAPAPPPPPPPPHAEPVELTTPRARAPDAACASMGAASPRGLQPPAAPPQVAQVARPGVSFGDIASNLSLLAQLGPGLGALSASLASGAKTLRAVRSPKPSLAALAPAAPLNLSDKHRSRHEHAERRPRGHHREPAAPVDEALWYWLKTQQAMLDLTAHGGVASAPAPAPAPAPRASPPRPGAAPAPAPSLSASTLDLNKNTWFWQYYKQFGGAMPAPEERPRVAAPLPRDGDILYSHLTKDKPAEAQAREQTPAREHTPAALASPPPAALASPPPAAEPERRSHARVRHVLDSLLFNNNNVSGWERAGDDACCNAENEFDGAVAEALEHGGKFLAWLEACRDPSVTRLHVHQLRALLGNIRARARPKPPAAPSDRVSRRK